MKAGLRRLLILVIKLAVAAGLLVWLIATGRLSAQSFSGAAEAWHWLVMAGVLIAVIPVVGSFRWYLLLRCQDFRVGYLRVLHLTLVGMFFNCISVGLVGGDVVKAYYVAMDQPRGKRAEAVYTVGFDRFVGVYALILLGTLALAVRPTVTWSDPRLRLMGLVLAGLLAIVTVGFFVLFAKRFRESSSIAPKIERWPGGKLFLRFYRAIKLYRLKPGVLLAGMALSCGGHMLMFAAIWQIARALGMPEKLHDPEFGIGNFVFCVAVGLTVAAVGPPLGIGVGQWSFGTIFEQIWGGIGSTLGSGLATLHQAVMLAVNLVLGLPAFLLVRREYARVIAEIHEDELDPAAAADDPVPPDGD